MKIPEDIHRQAKSAAAAKGLLLRDWIIAAIKAAINGKRS